jgi:hypothetical protein
MIQNYLMFQKNQLLPFDQKILNYRKNLHLLFVLTILTILTILKILHLPFAPTIPMNPMNLLLQLDH